MRSWTEKIRSYHLPCLVQGEELERQAGATLPCNLELKFADSIKYLNLFNVTLYKLFLLLLQFHQQTPGIEPIDNLNFEATWTGETECPEQVWTSVLFDNR